MGDDGSGSIFQDVVSGGGGLFGSDTGGAGAFDIGSQYSLGNVAAPQAPGGLGYSLTDSGGFSLPTGTPGITSDVGFGAGDTSGGGQMSLQQLMSLLGQGMNVGTGLNAIGQARQIQGQAAAADPLAPYRAGFAARLNNLVQDPSSITSDPGYQAGLQAVQRSGAAQGWTGSGQMMAGLADYGGSFYDRAIQRLAGLAGGTAGGGLPATQSAINLTNAGLNRISSGIASMGT